MLKKIEELLTFGINVSLERQMNHFLLKISKDDKHEQVLLPMDDHFTEHKIVKYLTLMQEKILNKDNGKQIGN